MISNRVNNIKPSLTIATNMKAQEHKRAGKDEIVLAAGEPDFDTPDHIKSAAIDAINKGFTKYVPGKGTPDLQVAIQKKFQRDNNLDYELGNITVGVGGKHIIYNAFSATINQGDEVIIPAPYWVSYPDIVILNDGKPIIVECGEQNGFKITPEDLEKNISSKTKWLMLNSPSNPTGTVYSKEELKDAVVRGFISFPFVWKTESMGYDGYGVKRLESASDLRNIPDTDCILEDPVQIKRELSVIVCRKKNNSTTTNDSLPDVVSYPPVEMIFNSDSNQVEYVYTIDDHKSDTVLAKATSIALDVSEQLGHTGLLAVELFQTIDDNILVNELAPRPHNSGHLTLSQPVSQFEQHLRAIMDYPLAPPLFTNSSVMINLVGSQGHDGPVKYQGFDCALDIPGVEIYLYGKKTSRPNRKMGHVVMTRHRGETTRMLLERAKKLKNTLTVVSIHES